MADGTDALRAAVAALGIDPAGVKGAPQRRVVDAAEPARFVAEFCGALIDRADVLLADPAWGPERRALVDQWLREDAPHEPDAQPRIYIATGGSTGGLKFAVHSLDTLRAAADAYHAHFDAPARYLCTLPLFHIGGIMQLLRALVAQDKAPAVRFEDYRDWLEHGPPVLANPSDWTVSLVPTQLARLLGDERCAAFLACLRCILLGGAAADPALIATARARRLPLVCCYGMTETGALVTALDIEAFHSGALNCGRPLPHARITIDAADHDRILIDAPSVCHGYWPARPGASVSPRLPFRTGDRGRIDESGCLHLLGRLDRRIVSGGKKIDPEEVEAVLRSVEDVSDCVVFGVPDPVWGERMVAAIACTDASNMEARARAAVVAALAPWQRPKTFLVLPELPRTAAGKIDTIDTTSLIKAARDSESNI